MKSKWIQLIAGLAMVAICISTYTTTTSAAVIWEDDFNDGNYDGWTICDNSTFHDGDYGWNGSTWSATNNYLERPTEDFTDWGIISHPSNVAYGRWSFDFNTDGTIFFISNNFYDMDDLYENSSTYFIFFEVDTYHGEFTIYLAKRIDNARTILDFHSQVPLAGWYHLDVTRNTTGYFSVYLDRSPIPIMQVEDTDINTSEMFWLWYNQGDMVDNIVVDDEPILPPPPFNPIVIVIVCVVAVGVIVLAIVILRRR